MERRDFLNGMALAIGAGALASAGVPAIGSPLKDKSPAANALPPEYPPALTGMRGSHDGSFDVMHSIA